MVQSQDLANPGAALWWPRCHFDRHLPPALLPLPNTHTTSSHRPSTTPHKWIPPNTCPTVTNTHHPYHAHTRTLHSPACLAEFTEHTQTSLRLSGVPIPHVTRVLSHALHTTHGLPATHDVPYLTSSPIPVDVHLLYRSSHDHTRTVPSGHHTARCHVIKLPTGGLHQQPPAPATHAQPSARAGQRRPPAGRPGQNCQEADDVSEKKKKKKKDMIWKISPGLENKCMIFDLFVIRL